MFKKKKHECDECGKVFYTRILHDRETCDDCMNNWSDGQWGEY